MFPAIMYSPAAFLILKITSPALSALSGESTGNRPPGLFTDMSHPEKALGAWVAAIRETFEEVGVLIARKKDGAPVTIRTDEERQRFGGYRQALIKGEMKFSQMLEAEDIVLSGDACTTFLTGLRRNLCRCAMMCVSL